MQNAEINYLNEVLNSVRKYLPIQAPLSGYIHNNVLQVLENKTFFDAIEEAHRIYDSNITMPIEFYQSAYSQNRINDIDIDFSLNEWIAKSIPDRFKSDFTNKILKSILLKNINIDLSFCHFDQDLQKLLTSKISFPSKLPNRPIRNKKSYRWKRFWLEKKHENFDVYVYPLLVKLLSTHLDQGLSYWPTPFSKDGLWQSFLAYFSVHSSLLPVWTESVQGLLNKYKNMTTHEILIEELKSAGIPAEDWESHLLDLSFDLRGWAGMVNKFETEPHIIPLKISNATLIDFFAIRFLLGHSLHDYLCSKHDVYPDKKERLYYYYDQELTQDACVKLWAELITRHLVTFNELNQFKDQDLLEISKIIYDFNLIDFKYVWHRSYEQNFVSHTLDTFYLNSHTEHKKPTNPYAKVYFCFDDREESLRRHLEEIDLNLETYGVVGFFGIDMNFISIHHPRKVAQCPPVVTPSRLVIEVPKGTQTQDSDYVNKKRSLIGKIAISVFYNSRSLIGGQVSTLVLGLFSFIPLSLRIFSPKANKKAVKWIKSLIHPEFATDFIFEKVKNVSYQGESVGYEYSEMADKVQLILKQAGTVNQFAPLMLMIGHGSSSANNPFIAAYGCGACGGRPGAPNARAFAMFANKKEVRNLLKERGLDIPETTYFVGAYHNTCSDEVEYFDTDRIPDTHVEHFNRIKISLNQALEDNAQERTRRFGTVGMIESPKEALSYVRSRAENLAEPRPEYGHSTNGITIVGKRDLSKDLFLDRRAFLISYDYDQDKEGNVLLGILGAAVPVCGGISLDYFFSQLDNEKFGCGSKLPLNVTSLLGVMTGAASDLRIGLPKQMVEIHEPMRITFIVETTEEVIYKIMEKNKRVSDMIKNQWVYFTLIDPATHELKIYTPSGFVEYKVKSHKLPKIKDSKLYYKNQSSSLSFAQIEKEN